MASTKFLPTVRVVISPKLGVQLGPRSGSTAQILSELDDDEAVVRQLPESFENGLPVEPVEAG